MRAVLNPETLFLAALFIVFCSFVFLKRKHDFAQRKRDFQDICNLIGNFRDNIHNVTYHTWGANKFKSLMNETIGAIVTGFKGHGLAGQAKGNKLHGQLHRGDYKSPIRRIIERFQYDVKWKQKYLNKLGKASFTKTDMKKATKFADDKIRKLELRIKTIPLLGVRLARDVDCKSDDRSHPGIDYILQGTIRNFNNTQYIQFDLSSAPSNVQQQWNFPRILAAIQSQGKSIQQVENRDGLDGWFGLNNFGRTSKPPFFRVTPNGIVTWEGAARSGYYWSNPKPWPHILENHTITLTRLVELADGSGSIDLRSHDVYNINANGNIPAGVSIDVTVYNASERAIEKIEDAGGTVNRLGWNVWAEEQDFETLLPVGDYLTMTDDITIPDGTEFHFRLHDDDGHPHWDEKLETHEEMLKHGIVYVSHHRDLMGRFCISVMMIKPWFFERKKIISKIRNARLNKNESLDEAFEINLRLWQDNDRREYKSGTYAMHNYGTRLLAHAVRNGDGDFEILHWSPNPKRKNDVRKPAIRKLLIGEHEGVSQAPIYPRGFDLNYSDDVQRRERAQWFFENCILGFYRAWWDFADRTNTTKNIGFSSLAEDMVRLYFGFRASRTETGSDANEQQGDEWIIHEIKNISGAKGDYMGNVHARGNMQLGGDLERILSWNGFFYVRIHDHAEETEGVVRGNLKMALLAPNQGTLEDLHRRTLGFYSRSPTSPDKLQFDGPSGPDSFDLNYVVGAIRHNELLHFTRCVEFIEHPPEGVHRMNILAERPNIVDCTCEICILGGLRWVPSGEGLSKTAWRASRQIVVGSEIWNLIIDH